MIEIASHPSSLANYRSTPESPFYFEVFGETSPQIDPSGAQLLVTDTGSGATAPGAPPIYEYWWTIGHGGDYDPDHHTWTRGDYDHDEQDPWNQLKDDIAARVYLFFPTWTGWRIKELAAQIKYLSPVRESKSLLTAVAQGWSQVSPLVSDAGQIAALFAPIPGAAAAAGEASTVLNTLAQLKINSVPPGGDYDWAAMKVTRLSSEGALQGVGWELPAKMFRDLGGRLTGSVALRFIAAGWQQNGGGQSPQVRPGPLRAHAVIRTNDHDAPDRWVPGPATFVELMLSPVAATTVAPAADRAMEAAGRTARVVPSGG